MTKLSIIIPFYNEPTLFQMLEQLDNMVLQAGVDREYIAVNDGSTDDTANRLKEKIQDYPRLQLYEHPVNRGKGEALKTGLQHCTGDIIIVQDADLEYHPDDIPAVIQPLLEGISKVCYGSRHLGKEQKKQNLIWFRKHFQHSLFAALGGRLITYSFNIFFFAHLTDALTCYKAFDAQLIKSLPLKSSGFELESEITARILRKTKILEVPVSYTARTRSEGKKIRLKDGFKSFATLIKYRFCGS